MTTKLIEVFKIIPGYSRYAAGDLTGKIINHKTQKQLKQYKNAHGYLRVCLVNDLGIKRTVNSARRIIEAHRGILDESLDVHHINKIRDDNSLINIVAVTRSENNKDKVLKSDNSIRRVCIEMTDGFAVVKKSFYSFKSILSAFGLRDTRDIKHAIETQTSFLGHYWDYKRITDTLPGEIWQLVNYRKTEFYISTFGRLKYTNNIPMNTHVSGKYRCVSIKKKQFYVHRLVAKTFLFDTSSETKKWVNHIDGNTFNNHVSNLEWVTPSDNNFHAHRTGLVNTYSHQVEKFNASTHVSVVVYPSIKETLIHENISKYQLYLSFRERLIVSGHYFVRIIR